MPLIRTVAILALLSVVPRRALAEEPPAAPSAATQAEKSDGGNGTAVGVAFGVALVGLSVAGVTGALMLDKRADLKRECDGSRACPRSAEDDLSAYRTYGTVSAVSLGVGVVSALTGFSLLLFAPDDERAPAAAQARLSAAVSPGFVAVRGEF